jgi:hypothetical protein
MQCHESAVLIFYHSFLFLQSSSPPHAQDIEQVHLFFSSSFDTSVTNHDACFQLVELVIGGGARFADVDVS